LKKLDELLEPDWDEDSQVTVNIQAPAPLPHYTPSQFEKLKEVKVTGKQAGIGGAILAVIAILGKLAQELGWFN